MYYNNLSDFYKNKFGCKVVKLSFDGGFSCPNRVNGSGGCIFCSGSYEFAGDRNKSLEEQYQEQRIVMDKKWPNAKYIAYFGSFTNTFDTLDNLKKRFEKVLSFDNVIGLSIGTRSDSISSECFEYLSELNKRTFLTVELGLQSSFNQTLKYINRGHDIENFDRCVRKLKELNINVVVHIIDGLPGETEDMMLDTVRHLNKLDINGIKIHNLFVVKNTLLGNPRKEDLIAPLWAVKKIDVLNGVVKKLKKDKAYQGIDYKEN